MSQNFGVMDVFEHARACAGITQGLNAVIRKITADKAKVCFLANDVDNEDYKKLVTAACKTHSVPLVTNLTRLELGAYVGNAKYDMDSKIIRNSACGVAILENIGNAPAESWSVEGFCLDPETRKVIAAN